MSTELNIPADILALYDRKPRYAPTHTVVRGLVNVPVSSYHTYLPGQHPKGCPLTDDCVALELRTAYGSRWWGVEKAWINSELRMVVSGFPARDELRSRWEVCTER